MIPFVDLKIQYLAIKREVDARMEGVLLKTNFILGESVAEFEEQFAVFCQSRYCVGVASGTDALHLALRALEIGPGDEVIVPANTFVATALAVSYTGAVPVFVDVDPSTYNCDFDKLEAAMTKKTKAIMPVHLYGRILDMDRLMQIAEKYRVEVVEDACQAHGALWKGKKAGSFGRIGCFSFYPGKNLGAYGDGGAIVTSDEKISQKIKMLRNYGSPKKYYHDIQGYNSRLDTLQAAVLSVKLKYLEQWNRQRQASAVLYNAKLKGVGDLVVPEIPSREGHVFHLYVVRTQKRDALLKFLNNRDIQAGIHYPVPLYALGAYAHLGLTGDSFPVTQKLASEIISLPMFPELSEGQVDEVVTVIKKFFA